MHPLSLRKAAVLPRVAVCLAVHIHGHCIIYFTSVLLLFALE